MKELKKDIKHLEETIEKSVKDGASKVVILGLQSALQNYKIKLTNLKLREEKEKEQEKKELFNIEKRLAIGRPVLKAVRKLLDTEKIEYTHEIYDNNAAYSDKNTEVIEIKNVCKITLNHSYWSSGSWGRTIEEPIISIRPNDYILRRRVYKSMNAEKTSKKIFNYIKELKERKETRESIKKKQETDEKYYKEYYGKLAKEWFPEIMTKIKELPYHAFSIHIEIDYNNKMEIYSINEKDNTVYLRMEVKLPIEKAKDIIKSVYPLTKKGRTD